MTTAVHLFAGPGGFDVGTNMAGVTRGVGLELCPHACATRAAAGHPTIRTDVSTYPAEPLAGADLMTGGPPCPTFSAAGNGAGRAQLDLILRAVRMCRGGWTDAALDAPWTDPRTPLVLQPLRYIWQMGFPAMVALEQVPPVLPVWMEMAEVLRGWGYSATAVVLNAADYGVPQVRKRAVLMASRVRPVRLPRATHARRPEDAGLFGAGPLPWVTMADALGWGMTFRPSTTLACSGSTSTLGGSGSLVAIRREMDAGRVLLRPNTRNLDEVYAANERPAPTLYFGARGNDVSWVFQRPATTIVGAFRPDVVAAPGWRTTVSRQDADGSVRVSEQEAATLQSFPAGYPFHGNRSQRFQQIGNAVPPLMAAAIVRALLCAS